MIVFDLFYQKHSLACKERVLIKKTPIKTYDKNTVCESKSELHAHFIPSPVNSIPSHDFIN